MLSVTYRAETSQSFFEKVSLDRVNPFNYDVQADIELFVGDQQWVLNVALDQELAMVGIARQVVEFLDERDAFAATTPRRFANEALIREVAHVLLQVFDLVRQQKGVWHETVVDWKETLQTADDDTEDVLLSEVVHERVAIDQGSFHLDKFDVVVAQGQPVVEDVAFCLVSRFSVAVLTNDVLDGVDLVSTVVGVDNDVFAAAVGRLDHAHYLSGALAR